MSEAHTTKDYWTLSDTWPTPPGYPSTVALICSCCQRVVRRDAVTGPLSGEGEITCTRCAPPRPVPKERELMEAWRELQRPKHPITGKPLDVADTSLWARACKVYDDWDLWRRSDGRNKIDRKMKRETEKALRELLLELLELERFTSLPWRLMSYGWTEDNAKLDAYAFLREAFIAVMPVLMKKNPVEQPFPGSNEQTKGKLLKAIQLHSMQLVAMYAEAERWWGAKGFRHRNHVKLYDQVSGAVLNPSNPTAGDFVGAEVSEGSGRTRTRGMIDVTPDMEDSDAILDAGVEEAQDEEVSFNDEHADEVEDATSLAGELPDDPSVPGSKNHVPPTPSEGIVSAGDHDLYFSSARLRGEEAVAALEQARKLLTADQRAALDLRTVPIFDVATYADEDAARAAGLTPVPGGGLYGRRRHLARWWNKPHESATGPGPGLYGRRDYRFMTIYEIAQVLGTKPAAVSRRLSRVRIRVEEAGLLTHLLYEGADPTPSSRHGFMDRLEEKPRKAPRGM